MHQYNDLQMHQCTIHQCNPVCYDIRMFPVLQNVIDVEYYSNLIIRENVKKILVNLHKEQTNHSELTLQAWPVGIFVQSKHYTNIKKTKKFYLIDQLWI